MATTPSSSSSQQPNGKWSALSIHERIRAMNETLDSVEQQQERAPLTTTSHLHSTREGVGGGGRGGVSGEPIMASSDHAVTPSRRSSVVDIWRQREASGESSSPSPPPPKQRNNNNNNQVSRTKSLHAGLLSFKLGHLAAAGDVLGGSTAAAARNNNAFENEMEIMQQDESYHHDDMGRPPQQPQQFERPTQQQQFEYDDDDEPFPRGMAQQRGRPARQSNCTRGIASASPAPPPMPMRRGSTPTTASGKSGTTMMMPMMIPKSAAAAAAPLPTPFSSWKQQPPEQAQAADMTIVPSPSSYFETASSSAAAVGGRSNAVSFLSAAARQQHQQRSTKVLRAWEKMSGGGGSEDGSWGAGSRIRTSTTTTTPAAAAKVINEEEDDGHDERQDEEEESTSASVPSSPATEKRRSVVDIWKHKATTTTPPKTTTHSWINNNNVVATAKPVAPPTLPKSPRAVAKAVVVGASTVSAEPTSNKPATSADVPKKWKLQQQPPNKWKEPPATATSSPSSLLFVGEDHQSPSSITNLEIVTASSNVSNISEASLLSSSTNNRWTQLRKLDQSSSSSSQQEPKTPLPASTMTTTTMKSTMAKSSLPASPAVVPKWKAQLKAAAAADSAPFYPPSTTKKSTFGGGSASTTTTPSKYPSVAKPEPPLPQNVSKDTIAAGVEADPPVPSGEETATPIQTTNDAASTPALPVVVPQWKVQLKPVGTNAPPSSINKPGSTTTKTMWSKKQPSAATTPSPLAKSQPSVLDRWKVATASPAPPPKAAVTPNWKKKTTTTTTPNKPPPIELPTGKEIVTPQQQDEPTMSETDIPSDDEMMITVTAADLPVTTAAAAAPPALAVAPSPTRTGKITDRWLPQQQSSKGVSTTGKPVVGPPPLPVWTKPVAASAPPSPTVPVQKLKEVSEPSVETAEASSVVSPLSPTASETQDVKSESLSSPSQSSRGVLGKPQVRSTFDSNADPERSMIPLAIECDTMNSSSTSPAATKPTTTPSSSSSTSLLQKITAVASPAVSRIVKEFGHRTPVATPRKNDRNSFSEEKNGSSNVSASSLPSVATEGPAAAAVVAVSEPVETLATPSQEIAVPEHLSGLVKNLGSRTPSGKKRLSIADRWTAKVSTSASKCDSTSKNQPEEDKDVIGAPLQHPPSDEDQQGEAATPEPVAPEADHERLKPEADKNPDSSEDVIETNATRDHEDPGQGPAALYSTPVLPRGGGVADRWKKRVATQKENSPDIQGPTSTPIGDQDDTPQGTLEDNIGIENESPAPGNDSLIQKLSFESDTRSNPGVSDVEVVLATSSQKDESINSSSLELPDESSFGIDRAETDIVEGRGTAVVESEEVEIEVGTARSALAGRRARKLTKSRIQKPVNHLQETKSDAGNQRRYPDFNRLVDRSRSMSSSLSPIRHRSTESLSPPPATSRRDERPSGLTPPRVPLAKSSRPASAPRPKMSKDADSIPTIACSSPIDLITSWNQKLASSAHPTSQSDRKITKAANRLPKTSGKVKKSSPIAEKAGPKIRSKKNFAQLGRNHTVKRPQQYSEGQDEESVEEELTQRLVQPDDTSSQKLSDTVSPSKFLAFREAGSVSPLDSRRFSSTPVMSNRRSAFRQPPEESFEQRVAPVAGETLTSRKLATEKATIKKRLNSRRRSRDHRVGNKPTMIPSPSTAADVSFGQESSIDRGSDFDALLLPDSATPSPTANSPDAALLPDGGTPSPTTGSPQFDQGLEATSSTLSSSSMLANKAERLLQERRRKGNDPDGDRAVEPQFISNDDDMEDFANRVRQGIPSNEDLSRPEEGYLAINRPRSDDSSTHGVRSLSSRYNVSSRFIEHEAESSVASSSLQDAMSNEDSSCMMSADSTAASPAVPQNNNRRSRSGSANPAKRKGRSLKPSDNSSVASDGRSTNTGTQSGWDASRVSDIASLMSFDLKRFASAVDERVAVLRDFVGGPSPDGQSPMQQDFDMEMEDVAIEVEYVEDDASELGVASSQSGDELVRRGYV